MVLEDVREGALQKLRSTLLWGRTDTPFVVG
jgi:hypothetical protein